MLVTFDAVVVVEVVIVGEDLAVWKARLFKLHIWPISWSLRCTNPGVAFFERTFSWICWIWVSPFVCDAAISSNGDG